MANNRRLPVYPLLDCSESMAGDAIDAVRDGMAILINDLRTTCPWCRTTDTHGAATFDVGRGRG
jgi:uncharacterized protein YegL